MDFYNVDMWVQQSNPVRLHERHGDALAPYLALSRKPTTRKHGVYLWPSYVCRGGIIIPHRISGFKAITNLSLQPVESRYFGLGLWRPTFSTFPLQFGEHLNKAVNHFAVHRSQNGKNLAR